MIIHYNCTIGSFLLHSFLLIYHPYPPSFHEMIFTLVYIHCRVLYSGFIVCIYIEMSVIIILCKTLLQGDITWYSDSASTVSLVVTQTDDNPACFEDTIIDYTEDMESGTASLLIQNSKAGGASGWSGNLMVTLGVGLLVSLFMTRCSPSTVCMSGTDWSVGSCVLATCIS